MHHPGEGVRTDPRSDLRVKRYEARLEQDLKSIRDGVSRIGATVQDNLWDAVLSLTRFDRKRANHTILRDRLVNRATEALDHECHVFVVRHLPSAGHLRFVSAVMRANVALERIGDYAVTICRETLQLSKPLPEDVVKELDKLGAQVASTVRSATESFVDRDVEGARAGLGMARQVEVRYKKVYRRLRALGESKELSTGDLFSLLIASRVLKRASDQAENLCEQTQFAVTGEAKEEKRYRLLFIDRDSSIAKMVEIFAEDAFPATGLFESASVEPAEAYAPEMVEFLERRGSEVDDTPTSVEHRMEQAERHYHVIVGLDVDPVDYIEHVPFRSVVLRWDLAEALEQAAAADPGERYTIIHRAIADEVSGLMQELGLESER